MTSKRPLEAANEAALLLPVVKIVLYARMDFAGGVRRFHTEIGPKNATHPVHGSEAYDGLGDFGGISSKIIESIAGAPKSMSISLSGVNASLVNAAVTDDYFRRDVDVLLGLEDAAGDKVEVEETLFSGFMDKVDITLDAGLAAMTMICESRGTNLLRSPDHRFTDEDLQLESPGNLGAEYVYRMADLQLSWGGFGVSPFAPPRRPGDKGPPHGPPGG